MKLHKVKKRTAACDELSRVEPKNAEGWNSFYYKLIERSDSTNPKSAI
jgi:hypothetical protein